MFEFGNRPPAAADRAEVGLGPAGVLAQNGKRIVATERDVAVRMYSTETGKPVWSREIPPAKNAESYTSAVAFSPDGKTIAAGAPVGPDESIYLLDAATGDVAGKLSGHGWKPWALAFTSDSKMLYSAGWDGVVRRHGTCRSASSLPRRTA